MDIVAICQKDGYKREDLSAQNKLILSWLDNLVDDIAEMKFDYCDTKVATLNDKMVNEIARDTIDDVIERAKITIMEYQIAFAESEDEHEKR